jgi:hypothetical protein
VRWATQAARLLRERDLDASPASVIETVRMAEALAALRDLPMAGLAELSQAILTVLCHGEPAPLLLIRDKLEIGERLGAVPNEAPAVPLQRDLAAQQRRLRLPATGEIKTLDLDLRNATDLARSHLLHRLALLRVPWGTLQQTQGRPTGSFHEEWQVQWQPELEVRLIEANIWGDTIEIAATNAARHRAGEATELPVLTALLDAAILAALSGAVDHLLQRVAHQAAMAADLRHLMDALPPLARVARYGDVRGTRAEHVLPVIDGLVERIIAGLAFACASLDDDAASAMAVSIGHVQESLTLLDRAEQRAEWHDALRVLIHHDGVHGLVRGWSCRLLLETQAMDEAELERLARLALSPATPATQAAAWVEGVLRGSGLVLLHLDSLWVTLDRWLRALDGDTFMAVLPLLRRAFSGFHAPERRSMGEKVVALASGGHPKSQRAKTAALIDEERAASVLPVLAQILGVEIADVKGRA